MTEENATCYRYVACTGTMADLRAAFLPRYRLEDVEAFVASLKSPDRRAA